MDRKIIVTGHGECMVDPDGIRVQGELSGICPTYAEAVNRSITVVSIMRQTLADLGFDWYDLKTSSFSVAPTYETEKKGDEFVKVFMGYSYTHGIKFEMDADSEMLGRVLEALVNLPQAPEIRVSFFIRDPSDAMKEARRLAVKDARRKAKELADAAGVKLGGITSITYAGAVQNGGPRARLMTTMAPDVIPDTIPVSDSVTIEWELC